VPLFLFHLLEYMDVDYELDIEEINSRWARGYGEDEVWGQLILTARHSTPVAAMLADIGDVSTLTDTIQRCFVTDVADFKAREALGANQAHPDLRRFGLNPPT
jgi:hypothetical protein